MKLVISYLIFFLLGGLLISSCGKKQTVFQVPVEYHKLDNGLKVVLSQDHTSPIVVVAVYYNIGFRIEPQNRTGFAHLFEHMMFQGSENLGKMEFIKLVQNNGGTLNGSTRFDFTNYFEILPAHQLETALWAEADRMRGLAITQENLTNQQGVVINEVKVNVLNQPYGGFPWLDMPQYANENWFNAHNFYGDLEDLEAANIQDVMDFYNTYYSPNNASLVVVGDFEAQQVLTKVKKHFGNIKPADLPPQPDISEPKQEKWKFFTKPDHLANRPALAFAYHMPERNSPEYYAMGLLDQILLQGDDSKLYQALVQEKGLTGGVTGGINMLGNMFNYNGPMLWMGYLFYDNNVSHEEIMNTVEEEIEKIVNQPLDQKTIDFAIVKMRSSLYNSLSDFFGSGRADLLASFALFDDDPARINFLEEHFRTVTPQLLQKTAKEYLKKTTQTVLVIEPKANS
jgi:predicted Zn-dependent peptidase